MSNDVEGQLREAAAGQPSEKVPDFIPGWFRRTGTEKGGQFCEICEAVRTAEIREAEFPTSFLRAGEFVGPAKPPQHGVRVEGGLNTGLLVRPGYWVVRYADDATLHLCSPDEFHRRWRRDHALKWVPPTEREEKEADDGWRGTPPAQGTRRKLVRDVLADRGVHPTRALDHADAVEAALLDAQILAEGGTITQTTFVAGGEQHRSEPGPAAEREEKEADSPKSTAAEIEPVPDRLLQDEARMWENSRFDNDRVLLGRLSRARAAEERIEELTVEREDAEERIEELTVEREDAEERIEELTVEREDACRGEDHFKAQRDSALNLLRWLIGDLIPNRGPEPEEGD